MIFMLQTNLKKKKDIHWENIEGFNLGGAKVVREMFSNMIEKLDRTILDENKFKNRWGEMDTIIGD